MKFRLFPVIFLAVALFGLCDAADKAKIVFISGKPSHGRMKHEHRAGNILLADALNKSGLNVQAVLVPQAGYPKGKSILKDAATVVIFCTGHKGHVLNPHLDEVDKLMKSGAGVVMIHWATEAEKGARGAKFLEWMGGFCDLDWSVNPHWTPKFKDFPKHPICNGVKPFSVNDEWYYHMRFQPNMTNVTAILSDLPGSDTLRRKDGPHSGNPAVRAAVLERKEPQHVAWVYQRAADYKNGRGFGFTGGHFHKNWKDDNFRKVVLNAIVWTAKGKVPIGGVNSRTPTNAEMEANQDKHGQLKGPIFQFPRDIEALYSSAALASATTQP